MKKFILLLVLIAFALPVVNAVPESFITGPYKVSFDLGLPHDAYNVTVNEPVIDEAMSGEKRTDYSLALYNSTGAFNHVAISIISLETPAQIPATGQMLEEILRRGNADDPRNFNYQSASRTIDGVGGAIASMKRKLDSGYVLPLFNAMYPPAFDPLRSMVNIASSYPWNEGTLQLLKTIHVEKV